MEPIFDTHALEVGQQATAWRQFVESAFAGMRVLELDPSVNGQVRAAQTPELMLLDIATSAMRARETPPPGGPELVYLAQIERGGCRLSHGGYSTQLQPGQFVFIDARRPADLQLDHATRFTLLVLPRERVARCCSLVDGVVGRPSDDTASDQYVAQTLQSFARTVSALTPRQRAIAASSFFELLPMASMMVPESPSASRWVARAQTVIDQRLHEPAFGPGSLADAVGVSRRYLDKQFAALGTSVARELWERRLRRAAHELRSPSQGHRNVGEIALGVGFSDAAHFTRAFRRRFGTTPSAFRRAPAKR
jgi:AraC-like DNA-binding protein